MNTASKQWTRIRIETFIQNIRELANALEKDLDLDDGEAFEPKGVRNLQIMLMDTLLGIFTDLTAEE